MNGYYQTRRGTNAPNAHFHSPGEAKEAKAMIRLRRRAGDTYAEIARDLGCSINTVRKLEQGVSYSEEE